MTREEGKLRQEKKVGCDKRRTSVVIREEGKLRQEKVSCDNIRR